MSHYAVLVIGDDYEGQLAPYVGLPGAGGNEPLYDADVLHKGDVDVEAMREEASKNAGERWDRVHAVVDGTPEPEAWESIVERIPDINEARDFYHAQERVVKVSEHDKQAREEGRHEDVLLDFFGSVEEFSITREEFVQQAKDGAVCPFAYVYRGEWFEPGRMGWFGVSSDTPEGRSEFQREFNEFFEKLSDDILLTLVDCHI